MILAELERILNETTGNHWAYVGGYATYLQLKKRDKTSNIEYGDYDIVVGTASLNDVLTAIGTPSYTGQIIIEGHLVSILSPEPPARVDRIDGKPVATVPYLINNYKEKLLIAYPGVLNRPSLEDLKKVDENSREELEAFAGRTVNRSVEMILKDKKRLGRLALLEALG